MNYVIDENEDAITDSKNTLRLYEDRDTISGNLCEVSVLLAPVQPSHG